MASLADGPGPLEYLMLGLASIGFVVLMGLIAYAFEPHYRAARDRVWRRLTRRRRRAQDLGRLPATWRPEDAERMRRLLRRSR